MEQLNQMKVRSPGARKKLKARSSAALSAVDPFLDSEGVMRAGGRLENATTLGYDSKFPMILPGRDGHVRSLIRLEQGHAGVNHVFVSLRRRFYLVGGREVVGRVIRHCVQCQKLSKNPQPQKMAPLPRERVDIFSPFENTRVDVFGPFPVKQGGRATHKRWVLLLTCLGCRAVHMELLKDMSTPTTINALMRFQSRRPGLKVLYSDNGTNFKGADNELKKAVSSWNNAKLITELQLRGVEWRFGPPHMPHAG